MKDNRLIAEFMEYELEGEVWVATMSKEDDTYLGRHLLFQTSWDWLMPVLEKVEQVNEGIPPQLIHLSLFSTINEVYEAVVEFIKNQNK